MKTTNIAIVTMALLVLSSSTLLATVKAAPWPNLPSTTVQLTVVDGTTSYFISTLSGVPAGFDVHNGVYAGWCVDRSVTMVRSVSHNVKLYSSISPPVLTGINWIAINYILNHKTGTMMNVQRAIWYFTDGLTPGPAAQAMINAAKAHPDYDPATGEILAIICIPQDTTPVAQNSIIELHHLWPGFTPGFWKHNIGVALGYNPGGYSAFEGGLLDGTKLTYNMLLGYATTVGVTLKEAYAALSAHGFPGADAVRRDMANAFNKAAGYGPYVD